MRPGVQRPLGAATIPTRSMGAGNERVR
jgi:hypothetical protein